MKWCEVAFLCKIDGASSKLQAGLIVDNVASSSAAMMCQRNLSHSLITTAVAAQPSDFVELVQHMEQRCLMPSHVPGGTQCKGGWYQQAACEWQVLKVASSIVMCDLVDGKIVNHVLPQEMKRGLQQIKANEAQLSARFRTLMEVRGNTEFNHLNFAYTYLDLERGGDGCLKKSASTLPTDEEEKLYQKTPIVHDQLGSLAAKCMDPAACAEIWDELVDIFSKSEGDIRKYLEFDLDQSIDIEDGGTTQWGYDIIRLLGVLLEYILEGVLHFQPDWDVVIAGTDGVPLERAAASSDCLFTVIDIMMKVPFSTGSENKIMRTMFCFAKSFDSFTQAREMGP